MPRSTYVPAGRLEALRARPEADRTAYTASRSWDGDCKVTVYASRAAMLAFCKDGSAHHALVKTPVHRNMVANRNTEVADASIAPPLDFA